MKKTNYHITSTQSNENNEIIKQSSKEYDLTDLEYANLWTSIVSWLHQDPYRSAIINTEGLEIRLSSYLLLMEN